MKGTKAWSDISHTEKEKLKEAHRRERRRIERKKGRKGKERTTARGCYRSSLSLEPTTRHFPLLLWSKDRTFFVMSHHPGNTYLLLPFIENNIWSDREETENEWTVRECGGRILSPLSFYETRRNTPLESEMQESAGNSVSQGPGKKSRSER